MAKSYYVSTKGSDRNNGLSADSPFETLQKAADLTQPGDTVYVMDGTYTHPDPDNSILTIRNSGTPSAWITYKAYPGDHPKLKSKNWNAINVQGASYIVVDGFTLEGNNDNITLDYALSQKDNLSNPATSGNGIGIQGRSSQKGDNSHHIIIRNNEIYKFGGAGIYSRGGDYITIENNSVHDNAWYSPFGNSGIAIWGGRNTDNNSGYKMIISGNTVYRNQELIPWSKVGKVTDGNGIIIDTLRNTDTGVEGGRYRGRTLVENNVVSSNGGRGIHVFQSDHVDVVNNTTFHNSQHPDVKDGEITAIIASDVRVFNNILYAFTGLPANSIFDATDVVYDYNLVFNSTRFTTSAFNNKVGQDPLFVNPIVGDFSLQANSPALNAAGGSLMAVTDRYGIQRPQGGGNDIGALEQVPNSGLSTKSGDAQPVILQGTNHADRLLGRDGDDQLTGLGGNDVLSSGQGRDILRGGTGDDKLIGGADGDTLFGDLGRDIFVLGPGDGKDTIRSFVDRQDRIDLVGGLSFRDLTIQQQGRDTLLKVGQNPLALLTNIKTNLITSVDFM